MSTTRATPKRARISLDRSIERLRKQLADLATYLGKGVDIAEFNPKWHTHAPDGPTADRMLRELALRYGYPEEGYARLHDPVVKEAFYGGE